jgi:uncharacterized protein YecT (DUF1311 family)
MQQTLALGALVPNRLVMIALVALIGGNAPPLSAASFDCHKEPSQVEKIICGSTNLSNLDELLNQHYTAQLLDPSVNLDRARRQQKAWIKERDKCSTEDCLEKTYILRIGRLSKHGQAIRVDQGGFRHLNEYSEAPDVSGSPATIRFEGCGKNVCMKFSWFTQQAIQQQTFRLFQKRDGSIFGLEASVLGRCLVSVDLQKRYVLLKDIDTSGCERPAGGREFTGMYVDKNHPVLQGQNPKRQ